MLATTDTNLQIPTTPGGFYNASALGEFAGATVTLQTFCDDDWRDVPGGTWTEPFSVLVSNGPGTEARLVLTGAGAATEIALNLTENQP